MLSFPTGHESKSPDLINLDHTFSEKEAAVSAIQHSTKIDTLVLLIPVHPADLDYVVPAVVSLYGSIMDLGGADGIVPVGPKAKKGSVAAFAVKLPLHGQAAKFSTETAATIQLKPKKDGGKEFRVEFHPRGLTAEGFKHVCETVLQYHLMIPPEAILAAKVTRVDIALDLHGVQLGDFQWKLVGPMRRCPCVKNGQLETLYLGSRKHGSACLYDKAKEQGLDNPTPWTRLELCPRPGKPLGALLGMKNPWLKMTPYDVRAACAAMPLSVLHREHALGFAQLYGISRFISSFPDDKIVPFSGGKPISMRQRMAKALEATVPAWWEPASFWSEWQAHLAERLSIL